MEIELRSMLKMTCTGVYCLLDEVSKQVQVFGSMNMLDHLNRILKDVHSGQYGIMKDKLNDLKLVVLETLETKDYKISLSKWIEYYEKEGYTFFKDTNLVRYKINKHIYYHQGRLFYVVFIQNKRKDPIVVGLFRKHVLSQQFIEKYYSNGVQSIVISDNEYTVKYREEMHKKLNLKRK